MLEYYSAQCQYPGNKILRLSVTDRISHEICWRIDVTGSSPMYNSANKKIIYFGH